LDIRPLRFRGLTEFLARHRGTVNSVAAGLGADVNHRIARACGARIENFVLAHKTERKRVHQWIARVARFELYLAPKVWHTKAIPEGATAAAHPFHTQMILMNLSLCSAGAPARPSLNRPKPQ